MFFDTVRHITTLLERINNLADRRNMYDFNFLFKLVNGYINCPELQEVALFLCRYLIIIDQDFQKLFT